MSTMVNNGTSRSAPMVSRLPEASIASRSSHLEASDSIFIISYVKPVKSIGKLSQQVGESLTVGVLAVLRKDMTREERA